MVRLDEVICTASSGNYARISRSCTELNIFRIYIAQEFFAFSDSNHIVDTINFDPCCHIIIRQIDVVGIPESLLGLQKKSIRVILPGMSQLWGPATMGGH